MIGNEIKSLEKEYAYVGESQEPFGFLSLDIKNKRRLQDALDTYVKPDLLEGENKYFCEKWDKKVDAHKRSYLKELSDTVVIQLKRFEYDYSTFQRYKINDYCEFPERIDFKPWTKQGIDEQENAAQRRRKQRKSRKLGSNNAAQKAAAAGGNSAMDDVGEESPD